MLGIGPRKKPAKRELTEGVEANVQCYLDLASGVYQLGRIDEAADLLARALDVAVETGEENPCLARVLNKLGVIRSRQGRHAEAERLLKRAVAVFERAQPVPENELAEALTNLGAVYRAISKNERARAAFNQALSIVEANFGGKDLSAAWVLDQLGDLDASEDNVMGAVFSLRRALAIKEQVIGSDNWDVAVTLSKLGDVYIKQARYNDAEPFLVRVVAIRERMLGWTDPAMAKPLMRLGLLYMKQRKDGRAEQLVRYALKLFSEVLPADHPEIIAGLNLLSEIYRGLSRFTEADAVWDFAQGLMDGSEKREKLAKFVFPKPPRFGPASTPALETGTAR